MLDFELSGLKALQRDLTAAGTLPASVQKEMVDAQAKVTEEAIIYNAGTMLKGAGTYKYKTKSGVVTRSGINYSTGDTVRSVKRSKPRMNKNGPVSTIKFEGMQHGNRNAEVAFVNEYGKKSQPARPFITKAIKESNNPAADAARKVLDQHLKNKNL